MSGRCRCYAKFPAFLWATSGLKGDTWRLLHTGWHILHDMTGKGQLKGKIISEWLRATHVGQAVEACSHSSLASPALWI